MIVTPSLKSGPEYRQKVPPANPRVGCTWYDLTTHTLKVFNGSDWDVIAQYDPPGAHLGIIASGRVGTNTFLSTVDYYQFPFDSGVSIRGGYATVESEGHAGTNSSTFGYYSTGQVEDAIAGFTSTINRLFFPLESGRVEHRADLSVRTNDPAAFNTSKEAYFVPRLTYVDDSSYKLSANAHRLDFAQDTGVLGVAGQVSDTISPMTFVTDGSAAYGWCGSLLSDRSPTTSIIKVPYPFSGPGLIVGNAAVATLTATGSACNSTAHGYLCGGTQEGTTNVSNIQRIAFPFDSGTATIVGYLTADKRWGAAVNSTAHGYLCGGVGTSLFSTVERLAFPFDGGYTDVTGYLSYGRQETAGIDGVDFVTQFV